MSDLLKELFVLNPETQMVDINKPWISTIAEFKALLKRDKSKSDGQVRRKLQAEKEFTFIYHFVDYRSSFADYSEHDRLKESLRNAGLDPNLDYTRDEELERAVEAYRAIKETAGLLLLNELKQGLHTSKRVVRKIRQDLEKTLDKLDGLSDDEIKELGGKNDPIITITERLDKIMEITERLPKTIKAIENLEGEIKKELADVPQLRGKDEKGQREDPGHALAGPRNPFG